jgi:tetratricopeptide (TPR) repeat protein
MPSPYLLKQLFRQIKPHVLELIIDRIMGMSEKDITGLISESVKKGFSTILDDNGIKVLIEVLDGYDVGSSCCKDGILLMSLESGIFEAFKKRMPGNKIDKREFSKCFKCFLDDIESSIKGQSIEGRDKASHKKIRIPEIMETPFREFGEIGLNEITGMPSDAGLSEYMIGLINYYRSRNIISANDSKRTISLIEKMSAAPGYLRFLDIKKKYNEVMRLYRIVRDVGASGIGPGPYHDDLMISVGIILFNIEPSKKLVGYLSRLKPSEYSGYLLYEYNAILALNYLLEGNVELASSHARNALLRSWDIKRKAYIRILQGCIKIKQMEPYNAIRYFSNAAELIKSGRLKALALFYTGIVLYEECDIVGAISCFEEARENITDSMDMITIHNNIGSCAVSLGDIDRAVREFEAMEKLAGKMRGNQANMCMMISNSYMGIISRIKGDHEQAKERYRSAIRMCASMKYNEGISNQLFNMGILYRNKNDIESALRLFRASLTYSEKTGYFKGIKYSFENMYDTMLTAGRKKEAEVLKKFYDSRYPDLKNFK